MIRIEIIIIQRQCSFHWIEAIIFFFVNVIKKSVKYLKILNDGNLFNFETMNKIHVKNTKKWILIRIWIEILIFDRI